MGGEDARPPTITPMSTPPAARVSARSAPRAGCAIACRRRTAGRWPTLDSRALCLARETLAYHDGLADFAFAMQGLGSGAIALAGSDAQKARCLPAVARARRSPRSRCRSPMPGRTSRR